MARGDLSNTDKIQPPASVDTEQALLGALINDSMNDAPRAAGFLPAELGPEHFYEPFHQRLYALMDLRMKRGERLQPNALAHSMRADPALEELGGLDYFGRLWADAPPVENIPDFARTIIDAATQRRLLNLADEIREAVREGTTGEELANAAATALTNITASTQTFRFLASDTSLDGVMDYIDNPAAHAQGVSTGLEPLDQRLGPLLPGDMIILGGRPGAGKSALAGIIARNVAQQGYGVAEIHGEMTEQQAWRRRLTATAFEMFAGTGPAYSSIRKRTITYDERQMLGKAREALRGIPLVAIKRTGITLGRLRSLVVNQRLAWERQGIPMGLLVIDHVGLLKTDKEHRSRVDQQTEISGALKEMADDLKVPILGLAQLNRQVEGRDDKRPTLSDLRDTGAFEQDSDVVIGAYRESYYAKNEKEPAQTTTKGSLEWAEWDKRRRSPWIDLLLLKVREGEPGDVRVWANMATNTILGAEPNSSIFGGF